MTPPHPIEIESYRILAGRADLSSYGPLSAAIVARVIHASADLDFATSMVVDDEAVEVGITALRAGAPLVVDVKMVRYGITNYPAHCHLDEVAEPDAGATRTASAMRRAAAQHPEGAVVAVGCAPTALDEVVRLVDQGVWAPALVIGLPVGFVGAAEAKEALRRCALPSISNLGEKGGSTVTAAAVNALVRLAGEHG